MHRHRFHLVTLGLLSTLLLAAVPIRWARAGAQIDVTNLNDSGPGSLREAITSAAGGDSIVFVPGLSGTISLTSGPLELDRSLDITGPGARNLVLDAFSRSRVLHVLPGATVRASGVTVLRGLVRGRDGLSSNTGNGGNGDPASGGGILNEGRLTLVDCSLQANVATGGDGGSTHAADHLGGNGGNASGGAIASTGSLALYGCTLVNNHLFAGSGGSDLSAGGSFGGSGGSAVGGAIHDQGTGFSAVNCTFAANEARGGDAGSAGRAGGGGGPAQGGAIYLDDAGTSALVNCTLTRNVAVGARGGDGGLSAGSGGASFGGGLSDSTRGTRALTATLVALNQVSGGAGGSGPHGNGPAGITRGPDVYSPAGISQGHNLVGITDDSSTGWLASDRIGTASLPLDPGLGTLRNNGGGTDTIAILPGSPAIEGGDDAILGPPLNLSTDQRGVLRRIGAHVDIGAFEFDPPQPGPEFLVTTLDDHDDRTAGGVDCTLREAINAAPSGGTVRFRPGLAGTLTLQLGELVLSRSLTILGPGARTLAVAGRGATRVIRIAAGSVSITGLTVREGVGLVRGGGIFNAGTLNLSACALNASRATGGPGGAGQGGGIYNQGTLSLTQCTLSGNQAIGGPGEFSVGFPGGAGGPGEGGGIYSTGTLTLTNCTLSDNHATGGQGGTGTSPGSGGAARGGALFSSGPLTLTNATLAGNDTAGGNGAPPGGASGGGLFLTGSSTLRNTLVAQNAAVTAGPDVAGIVTSQGHNLAGKTDGSTGWIATDKTGTVAQPLIPRLGPLHNNGGPTDTRSLFAGSPALDAGNDATAPATDQRGASRAGVSDIGAFESGGQFPMPPADAGVSSGSGASGALGPRLFTAKYSDPNGAGDLAAGYLLINTSVSGANALYGWYDAVNNKLFLRNNADTAWLGGFAPGSAHTISDPAGKGSLDCARTAVARAGNLLTVTWSLTARTAFTGAKNLYLFARDKAGLTDGWDRLGTWTVTTGPSNLSISPAGSSSAAGTAHMLTATYVDPNGNADIGDARLLANGPASASGGLMGLYDARANKLFLRDNANTAWLGGFAPGSANVIRDPQGQGSLDCAATRVTRSGTTLTITWSLTPAANFAGAKNLFLFVKDSGGLSDGLEALGTWTVQ